MSHFAKVENGVVTQVIVIEQDVVDTGLFGDPALWVQTSYNTYGGQHRNGGTPMRKNYAGIGYVYDSVRDAFYAPQPFSSWSLNEDTCIWESPVAMPTDGKLYSWDEATTAWIEIVITSTGVIEGLEPTITTVTEVTPLSTETVSTLSTSDVSALSTDSISALSTSDVSALSTNQISALSTSQI